jgi:hypothetical protein
VPPPASTTPVPPPFTVGLWGDTPYSSAEQAQLPRMIDEMNGAGLAFSVFDGDLKGGGPCDNRLYTAAIATFDRFTAPMFYVPGDNEWTDCRGVGQSPRERLDHIRRTMFASGHSFGQRTMPYERQSDRFPEHTRWQKDGVLFVTLNVPGSDDGITDGADPDRASRDGAMRSWLEGSFALAHRAGAPAVMIVIQADPGFDVPAAFRPGRVDGYEGFIDVLRRQAVAFGRPVVLVHGDTHRFRVDKPVSDPATGQRVENLTRVETMGSPDVGWVKATVDLRDPDVFHFEPRLVSSGAARAAP